MDYGLASNVSLLSPSLIACANLAIDFSSRPAASIPPVIKKTYPSIKPNILAYSTGFIAPFDRNLDRVTLFYP
jgi:hypothetical protein